MDRYPAAADLRQIDRACGRLVAARGYAVPRSPEGIRGEKTHYAASLMSAADQQIPDDTRVVLEELITETGR